MVLRAKQQLFPYIERGITKVYRCEGSQAVSVRPSGTDKDETLVK
jgi:hypothetical protein